MRAWSGWSGGWIEVGTWECWQNGRKREGGNVESAAAKILMWGGGDVKGGFSLVEGLFGGRWESRWDWGLLGWRQSFQEKLALPRENGVGCLFKFRTPPPGLHAADLGLGPVSQLGVRASFCPRQSTLKK